MIRRLRVVSYTPPFQPRVMPGQPSVAAICGQPLSAAHTARMCELGISCHPAVVGICACAPFQPNPSTNAVAPPMKVRFSMFETPLWPDPTPDLHGARKRAGLMPRHLAAGPCRVTEMKKITTESKDKHFNQPQKDVSGARRRHAAT